MDADFLRVVQYAKSLKIPPPWAFSHSFWCADSEIAKKKSKKSSFWPSSMGVYSTLLWPCSKSGRFLFQGPNHPLNAAKSHPNPPRTKQDLKNIDFSLLDLQNSLIGSLFRWFFQMYKIAYKSRLDQTWFLALNHPLDAAKSPPNRGRRYYRNRSGIAIPKGLVSVSESNFAHPWVSVSVSVSNFSIFGYPTQ